MQPGSPPGNFANRLFIAVFPDRKAAARIAALAQDLRERHGLRGKSLHPDRLHVTLLFLGDNARLPLPLVAAQAAGASVRFATFEITFDRVETFTGHMRRQPLVLCGGERIEPLVALQCELAERMRATGLPCPVARNFAPHVTLLYDQRALAGQTVEPITWTVRGFMLVHSLGGRGEYRILGSWPTDKRDPS